MPTRTHKAARTRTQPSVTAVRGLEKFKFGAFHFFVQQHRVHYEARVEIQGRPYLMLYVSAHLGDDPTVSVAALAKNGPRYPDEAWQPTRERIAKAAAKVVAKAWARLLLADVGGPGPPRTEGRHE
jgi:hypothetical protein